MEPRGGGTEASGRSGHDTDHPGGLDDPRVADLLRVHLASAQAQTAPGSAHALDLDALRAPGIGFWAMWAGTPLAVAALKRLSPRPRRRKSMHTAEAARRQPRGARCAERRGGAGGRHVAPEPRDGLWHSLPPERTGATIVECPPFADYGSDPNSVFLSLDQRGLRP